MEEKFKCLGDCRTCELLLSNNTDPVLCPIRIVMSRTGRIEKMLSKVLELLESTIVVGEKPQYKEILVEESENESSEDEV